MSLDSAPESLPRHRNASIARKDAVLGKISFKQFKPGFGQVAGNPEDGFFPHGHEPFLRALSPHSNNALATVDFTALTLSEFADSKPAALPNFHPG